MSARAGAVLTLALVVVFLTLGVPRWLEGDVAPARGLSQVCRAHGGTPKGQFCTVRYAARTYVMDAVTPGGFDEDAARFNRQGCEQPGGAQAPMVFHSDTGVCENAPGTP